MPINEEFEPVYTKSISVSFQCPDCNKYINDVDLEIPKPFYEEDSNASALNIAVTTIECERCKKQYNFTVSKSLSVGEIYSDDFEDEDVKFNIET